MSSSETSKSARCRCIPQQKLTRKTILILLSITALLCIVVPIIGIFNAREGQKKREEGAINYDLNNAAEIAQFSGLEVYAGPAFVDANNFAYKLTAIFAPSGSYESANNRLSRTLQIYVDGRLVVAQAGQPISEQTYTLTFSDGDNDRYPFDVYTHEVEMYAIEFANATQIAEGDVTYVPLAVIFGGAIQGWTITSKMLTGTLKTDVLVSVSMTRSITTQFFSIFVITLMWLLSLSILSLTVSLYVRKRKVEPPMLALSVALLFAMPAIRNVQPGVPPIGITIDAVGFFWNMSIIAICAILLTWNYIYFLPVPAAGSPTRDPSEPSLNKIAPAPKAEEVKPLLDTKTSSPSKGKPHKEQKSDETQLQDKSSSPSKTAP
jgi:hypothetical protein